MQSDNFKELDIINKIARKVSELGGQTYFVGGCVRDELLELECKDYDVEVYGIEPTKLEEILDSLGERIEIGKAFSVYALKGYNVDVALPRREVAVGEGHKDFEVVPDPFISTLEAATRRDFTINAMLKNVITGEIVDHFGGIDHLKAGVLRHVNTRTFAEDPLRVFRCAQFSARFDFTIDCQTEQLCKSMKVSALPKERVFDELNKALLKADKPSVFFEALRKMQLLDCFFPQLKALIGVKQSPRHHKEGDVWVHTMMVLDQAAKLREKAEKPLEFMLAALTHDLGKAVCTQEIDGEIHAYNHEIAGIPIAKSFLSGLTNKKSVMDYVLNMVKLHMRPNVLAGLNSSVKSTNKLFDSAISPVDLIYLATADGLGKIATTPYVDNLPFLMQRLEIYRSMMSQPYVMGKDLIAAGLQANKNFSKILGYAHKLRLAGIDKQSALKQTLAFAKKLNKQQKSQE